MTLGSFPRFLLRFLRNLLIGLAVVLLLLVGAVAWMGYTASGNQFLAERISEQVSTPDMQVELSGASGLLEGRFHLDRAVLSDTRGKFAEVKGLDLFWKPAELLSFRFHAERISTERVILDRLPVTTIESPPSDTPFSLPVEIKIDSIDLPLIALGEPIVGREAMLIVAGSAEVVSDRIALDLGMSEASRPDATARARMTYAVNAGTLMLDASVNEPQGGMLATALKLPGVPPVEIAVAGDGPLENWDGSVNARVAGQQVLSLEGHYRLVSPKLHDVVLEGGGEISELLPPEFRSLFSGTTDVDVAARFGNDGVIEIRSGKIANDSLIVEASGALDPKGDANLTADIRPAGDTIAISLPSEKGAINVDVSGAKLTLNGPFRKAAIAVDAKIADLATADVTASALSATARSENFDLAARQGRIAFTLNADTLSLTDPNAAKVIQGPLRVGGNADVAADLVTLSDVEIESARLGGKLDAAYTPSGQTANATFNLFVLPQGLLSPEIEARLTGTLGLSGQLQAELPSKFSVSNLKLTSNLATVVGSASSDGTDIKADFAGELVDVAALTPKATGRLTFTLVASGPLTNPAVEAKITSGEVLAAGRAITDLAVSLQATADPKAPGGTIIANLTLDGQPIAAEAKASYANGLLSIPAIKATIGSNLLSGSVNLDAAFLPTGRLDIDFADLSTLASLADQQVQGDLKGTLALAPDDGRITAKVELAGQRIASSGAEVINPRLDLSVSDLLGQRLSGTIAADRIAQSNNGLDDVVVDVGVGGQTVTFDLKSRFEDAPLLVSGKADIGASGQSVTLTNFTASPKGIPVKLSKPTEIAIINGAAQLSDFTIKVGEGSISVNGNAGQTLQLDAAITALPLALANTFAPDLAAEGNLSADVTITGPAASPIVDFKADLDSITTSQIKGAGLPDLTLSAKGQFVDNRLTLDVTSDIRQQPVNLAVDMRLDNGTIDLPSIKADIGSSTFSGAIKLDRAFQPSGKIAFDIPDAAALAAIVGQKAEGAIKGTADIASAEGAIKVSVDADGTLREQDIALKADVTSRNGAVSVPSLKLDIGANTLTGGLTLDEQFQPSGTFDFDFPDMALLAALAGQKAEGALKGTADVATSAGKIDARIDATGTIRDQQVDIELEALSQNGKISLPALKLDVGANTLAGALDLDKSFLPTGKISFDFPDIGLLAAFAGQQAEGAIKGTADLTSSDGRLAGTIQATGSKIVAAGVEILKPVIDLTIVDIASGQVSGRIAADRLAQGENVITDLGVVLDRAGSETRFDLKARYDGAPLQISGSVEQKSDAITVALDSFSAAPRKIPLKLTQPARIEIRNGTVALDKLTVAAGKGSVVVSGKAGETLDLNVKVTSLPASLANTFSPGLDATGTITANATIKGKASAPEINFDTNWQNAALAQTRAAGLTTFTIAANGQVKNNTLTIDTTANSANGLSLTAKGTVGLTGNRPLAIKVNGKLPFTALASRLVEPGIDLKGNAAFDISLSGSATNPSITGQVTTSGATLTVIRQNLTINNLSARVDLDGKQARITSLKGKLAAGGTIEVSGTVGITPDSGFPADLKIALNDAVYTDAKVVAAKVNGELGVTGSLVGSPVLSGRIRIRRADITIPEKLPGSLAQLDVQHKNAPRDVIVQSKEIKADLPANQDSNSGSGIALDLKINAPRQIFVRGRGLDAELGGEVRVTGTANSPNVSGSFKMLRGRLSIIGRRLDFSSGTISFGGDMMPSLNLVATSQVNATTVNVTVSGPASDPSVSFTSSPSLPQDEVLALLIFGRSSASLSPVQIAQLADAVSTLAGGQSNSLFSKLRQGLGVDDLDVGTDENGKSNVSAGKYLNKRTYLQLQQGVDDGTSKAVINLDIGKGVKLRGEAGTDGSTAGGLFYEKEY